MFIPASTHNCFVATNTLRILNSCRSLIHTEYLMSIKWIETQFNCSVSKNKTEPNKAKYKGGWSDGLALKGICCPYRMEFGSQHHAW